MITPQTAAMLAPLVPFIKINEGVYFQVQDLMETVPFRLIIRQPIDRLASTFTFTMVYWSKGEWTGPSHNLDVADIKTWFDVFSTMFSNTYYRWLHEGSPRDPYEATGKVWSNK